jgi:hypothetical protein
MGEEISAVAGQSEHEEQFGVHAGRAYVRSSKAVDR